MARILMISEETGWGLYETLEKKSFKMLFFNTYLVLVILLIAFALTGKFKTKCFKLLFMKSGLLQMNRNWIIFF